jgi:inhibitor of KinA sporulation pathway (predicted exonuclease)
MGANLDRLFVVDVEATCWETREEQGDRPNEIIEIGVCEVNLRTGEVLPATSYVVKPVFTDVSPFCTQLTGWTKEDIDGGGNIKDTLAAIGNDHRLGRDDMWCSYGEFDRHKLCGDKRGSVGRLYGVDPRDNPFAVMRTHFNIKTLFAIKHRLTKEVAMDRALELLKLPMVGRHHNGADDAYNIAKIALATLR